MRRLLNLLVLSCWCGSAAVAQAPYTYYPKYNYPYGNGYRVFLSPATHSPDRQSCLPYVAATENEMAWANSWSATEGFSDSTYPTTYDLTERGYTVQIGDGTNQEKVNQANSFGAHIFLSVHSNGAGGGCSTPASTAGTWSMYRTNDSNSQNLAAQLDYYLRGMSPGTNDKLCLISSCSQYTTLFEMESSNAYSRAYLEQEFHDFEAGAKWMYHDLSWQWRIAGAIDNHYGSPR